MAAITICSDFGAQENKRKKKNVVNIGKYYFSVTLVAIYFNQECNVYVYQLILAQPLQVINQYGPSAQEPTLQWWFAISIRYTGNNFSFMNKNLPDSTSPLLQSSKLKAIILCPPTLWSSVDRADLMVVEAMITHWVNLQINIWMFGRLWQKLAVLVMILGIKAVRKKCVSLTYF